MVVTPWEVKGKVDYERLIREFGTQPLTPQLLERVEKHTDKLHLQLERKIFFSHRDLDTVLDLYDKGIKFVLYTGRGPSGPVHIGHLVPWIFTLHIQQKFNTRLYFQMTDDEKYLIDDDARPQRNTQIVLRKRLGPNRARLQTGKHLHHLRHRRHRPALRHHTWKLPNASLTAPHAAALASKTAPTSAGYSGQPSKPHHASSTKNSQAKTCQRLSQQPSTKTPTGE